MNLDQFEAELEVALVDELKARQDQLSEYVMASFDLGIHPWHGIIEPSFYTTQDTGRLEEIGGWKLYNFAFDNEPWPRVQHLAKWMQTYYESNPSAHSENIFTSAAKVARSKKVSAQIQQLKLTNGFFVSVYNPDDNAFKNYCA